MTAEWANRIGMTLQFLSLWLVTPQVIGEEAMHRVATRIRDRGSKITTPIVSVGREVLSFRPLVILFWTVLGASALAAELSRYIPVTPFLHTLALTIRNLEILVCVPLMALTVLVPLVEVTTFAIKKAADSTQGLLAIGAATFTLGFVILMWATWL